MMAGMAASLSGLVNGAPGLEIFFCLITCSVNHRQPQVSLQQLQFLHILYVQNVLLVSRKIISLHNTDTFSNRFPHPLYFISLFGSDSRAHKRIYFNVNYFTASHNGIPPIEFFRWITHISYRLPASSVPVRWALRNSFESIKLGFFHNT